jgi:hypothetical protein
MSRSVANRAKMVVIALLVLIGLSVDGASAGASMSRSHAEPHVQALSQTLASSDMIAMAPLGRPASAANERTSRMLSCCIGTQCGTQPGCIGDVSKVLLARQVFGVSYAPYPARGSSGIHTTPVPPPPRNAV